MEWPLEDAIATEVVALSRTPANLAVEVCAAARPLVQPGRTIDVEAAVGLAADLGERLPVPGTGSTRELWESLASLGAMDLTLARVVEPHADALAILSEARRGGYVLEQVGATYGVYAAEGPGARLAATEDGPLWRLSGTKPWCSLADRVGAALVTAWVDTTRRGLFRVSLDGPDVEVLDPEWISRGLAHVTSGPVRFDEVLAEPVGEPDWYLRRPGFAWGGLGVAAIWYGGAVGVARRLRVGSRQREPDQIGFAHLGRVDACLSRARSVLAAAAEQVDAGNATGEIGSLLALRVRQVVAESAEQIMAQVNHGLGPAPLVREEAHARRIADLTVYLRQQHGDRDAAALGRKVLALGNEAGW